MLYNGGGVKREKGGPSCPGFLKLGAGRLILPSGYSQILTQPAISTFPLLFWKKYQNIRVTKSESLVKTVNVLSHSLIILSTELVEIKQ